MIKRVNKKPVCIVAYKDLQEHKDMKYTLITLAEKVLIIGLWFYYPEQTIGSDLVQHLSYLYLFNGNRRT